MNEMCFQYRLFESFRKHGSRTAIEYGDRCITYSMLEKRAAGVYLWIKEKKIKGGDFIGIYLEDRVDLIAAMIGILAAGCVFVTLDMSLPKRRIEEMLGLTGTSVVLISVPPSVQTGGFADINRDYDPYDPIYVYFTSGSTGVPRAILGKNESLRHFIDWETGAFGVDAGFRVSQFAGPGFDAFLKDVFVPLVVGGVLCIPAKSETVLDGVELVKWINRVSLTLIHCVPGIFRVFNTPALTRGDFKGLKYVVMAGERVKPKELKNWFDIFDERIQPVNLYGPTETTLIKTCYFIGKEDLEKDRIPVGKPIRGAQVIIFDKNMEVCGREIAGEIYIRTPYGALGYTNEPGLTRGRFISNPFSRDPWDVLYKTGDAGRILVDGNIDLLGRLDRQIKIRGVRVEPGEIENALIGCTGIREAAAVLREVGGEEVLCAYLVSDEALDIPRLREDLAAVLPDYMVPAYFIRLDKIPLTPNGKTDYRALPVPGVKAGNLYRPPSNDVEEKLASIWSEVLGIEKGEIGTGDNFFHLGGHSLRAAVLAARIRQTFEVDCPLSKIFETPFIADLEMYIRAAVPSLYEGIPAVEEREYYPQSSAQKRLYFLERFEDIGTASNMPMVFNVTGKIDGDRLITAFDRLIHRHEALRTSFHMVNGEPVQKIHESKHNAEGILRIVHPLPGEDMKDILKTFVRPFDLSNAPLLRVGLAPVAETGITEYVLMIDIHHIIVDGTSAAILADELIALYAGEDLPGPVTRYRDFSLWQNGQLETGRLKRQESHWLRVFHDAPDLPVLDLPVDLPRPEVFTFDGERIGYTLEGLEVSGLKKISEANSTTLFMNLLAVFDILLHKYTGQDDLIVGCGVAGRRYAELQGVIGLFVNMLPLRNHPSPGKTFERFLREVKTVTVDAFENQDVPFEELVEKLRLKRDVSRNPLFDVSFVNQNFEPAKKEMDGVAFTPYRTSVRKACKFDLTLFAYEGDEKIFLSFEYYSRVFKKETVRRWADHFVTLVRQVTVEPGILISNLDILSEMEKRQLLFDFNDTAVPYPADRTIHGLFEDRVEQSPDNIAVVGPVDGSVTYKELNERANQLADYLMKEEGVRPDDRGGVLMEQSIDRLISVLGILKAGGGYVPMEPGLPDPRLRMMVCDADIGVIVSRKNETLRLRRLKLDCPSFRFFLRIGMEIFHGLYSLVEDLYSRENPVSGAGPRHLAYVIYTSGTTGTPAGVMVEHRSLVNLCCWHNRFYGITEGDRATQYASFGFDASVWEIFPYLIKGASIHLVPEEIKLDIHELNGYFEQRGITSAFLPTRLCEQFVALPNRGLKRLLTGGERLGRGTRPGAGSRCTLYNNYGPTETTVVAAVYEVQGTEDDIPIGRPVDNTQVYILDRDTGQLRPIGAPGELCIAGDGLARGYINDPERTDRMNRPNRSNWSYRTYWSGDLARRLADGSIQFLGRSDRQVKIRGFRIELGEIEKRLTGHPAVKEAAAVLGGETNGDPYLCAFIVPGPGDSPNALDPVELKHYLSFSLPGYMIPAHFVTVDKIPLTARGKIDTGALPFPRRGERSGNFAPPKNETQVKLAEIWSEVLGIGSGSLGIDDNFFDRGGHSLKAAALLSKIREVLGIKVPLARVFQHPTVRGLARYIDDMGVTVPPGRVDDERMVLLKEGTVRGRNLFFIHAGSGEVGGYTRLAGGLEGSFFCWGIRAERMETYVPREITVEEAAREYIKKIRGIQARGPYNIIGRCFGGTIGFEMVRQLETAGETVGFFGVVDSPAPKIPTAYPDFPGQVKSLLDYLPVPGLREKVGKENDLKRIWTIARAGLERYKNNTEVVKELERIKEEVIPPYLREMLPGMEGRDAGELFYYLTLVRMYANARDCYVPAGKIETVMHCIVSSGGRGHGKNGWDSYCTRPVVSYPVEGDRFSIFQPPYVEVPAGIFNRLLDLQ